MFDANMRHLPKGKKFFAEMCGAREGHPIRYCGVKSRLVVCQMLSSESENPTVRFYGGDRSVDISDSESGIGSWFVYAGNIDGTGFIDDELEALAMNTIKGGKSCD